MSIRRDAGLSDADKLVRDGAIRSMGGFGALNHRVEKQHYSTLSGAMRCALYPAGAPE